MAAKKTTKKAKRVTRVTSEISSVMLTREGKRLYRENIECRQFFIKSIGKWVSIVVSNSGYRGEGWTE